jgi:hypothetical protein
MAKDTPKPRIQQRPAKQPPGKLRVEQTLQPVDSIHQQLIGRVAIEWAMFENCLNDMVLRFIGLPFEDGRLLTQRLDPSKAIALLRVLGPRYLQGEPLQELVDILAMADQLRGDRNFIIHGTWAVIMPENHPTASSVREKSEPDEVVAEHFPRERMIAIIGSIIKTKERLVKLSHLCMLPY